MVSTEMIEIKGVVVEVPCEACGRSGFVKATLRAFDEERIET